ncbi:hypothetical protein D9611_005465 [Ephemerocybe angulata]|uniref:Uncharacterized protein n=1 Tax=Ephemerocybe angulata TaxID=980116 RepID=A0A8H5C015_9AGAR|nr:hypothetical protein D9611_005465 [Tulosesus angulatus]
MWVTSAGLISRLKRRDQKLRKKTSKLDASDPDPPMSMEACRAMVFHDESLSRYPDMSISMATAAKSRSKAFSGYDSEGVHD